MSATAAVANPQAREPTLLEWAWVMRKLNKRDMLSGKTDRDIRVHRWRKEILKRGWGFADSAAGRRSDGTYESWAALFLRATGETLSGAEVVGDPEPKKNGGNNGGESA